MAILKMYNIMLWAHTCTSIPSAVVEFGRQIVVLLFDIHWILQHLVRCGIHECTQSCTYTDHSIHIMLAALQN